MGGVGGRVGALIVAGGVLGALLPATTAGAQVVTPCTTTWKTADTSGRWDDATKWTAGVPDIEDHACITAAGGYTVTVDEAGGVTGTLTLAGPGANDVVLEVVSAPGPPEALVHLPEGGRTTIAPGGRLVLENGAVNGTVQNRNAIETGPPSCRRGARSTPPP